MGGQLGLNTSPAQPQHSNLLHTGNNTQNSRLQSFFQQQQQQNTQSSSVDDELGKFKSPFRFNSL